MNVSLGFYFQNVGIGETVLDVNTTAYGINISKTVGGGVAGVTAAWFLSQQNLSVAIIEKGRIACEQEDFRRIAEAVDGKRVDRLGVDALRLPWQGDELPAH